MNISSLLNKRIFSRTTSDHYPILTECEGWEKGKGYFKFENLGFEHQGFIELTENSRSSCDIQGEPEVVLSKKLIMLKSDLQWNKRVFGN